MTTSRNERIKGHRFVVFHCDEDNCDEEFETGYETWHYALAEVKREKWYVLPEEGQGPRGGELWLHLCPVHGKAEWIKRQEAKA